MDLERQTVREREKEVGERWGGQQWRVCVGRFDWDERAGQFLG